mgnify:CR=1 FL=1
MTNKDLISKIASSTSMTKTHTEELLNATVAVIQKEKTFVPEKMQLTFKASNSIKEQLKNA